MRQQDLRKQRERAGEKWEWRLSAKEIDGQRRKLNEVEEKNRATLKRDRQKVREK